MALALCISGFGGPTCREDKCVFFGKLFKSRSQATYPPFDVVEFVDASVSARIVYKLVTDHCQEIRIFMRPTNVDDIVAAGYAQT